MKNIYKGKKYTIMDIETHKPLRKNGKEMKMNSITVAREILNSLGFGLKNYYCIFDNHKGRILEWNFI